MKFTLPKLLLTLALMLFGLSSVHSQTLNWISPFSPDFTSRLADSKGNALDSTFTFEIGTFKDGFTPEFSNAAEWYDQWVAFDAASYNEGTYDPVTGYVTGTAQMNALGQSTSPDATSSTFSFAGLQAYLWVRNATGPDVNSEWALVRANSWTFPAADPNCCGSSLPVNWSVSDLSNEIPIIGAQNGIEGSGARQVFSPSSYLQTYTFVPEPSCTLLMGMAALLLARRRRD